MSEGRGVFPPQRQQAKAREAAMDALRAMPAYNEFLLSLRQRWATVQVAPISAMFASVRALEDVQHARPGADQFPGWDIRPSPELRTYLHRLNEIVERHLHLTDIDAGTAAWWVKQDLHTDALKHDPCPWHDRVDLWRFEAPHPAPEVRITTEGFGVRVTLHDPATGVHLWHPDPETEKDDPARVFPDLDAALAFVADTITQHYMAQGWRKNPASEAKMLKKDIPALMTWYVDGKCPADEPTQRRLQDLARKTLMLNPPRKTRGNFFADLAKQGGYSADDE